jgi:hypothetical protein
MTDDPRLRLRVYVARELRAETWIDVSNPDCATHAERFAAEHSAMSRDAEARGDLWAVEIHDPGWPDGPLCRRFGTDLPLLLELAETAAGEDAP